MTNETIIHILEILKTYVLRWKEPVVSEIAAKTGDPFKILISTIISLRTKDEVTAAAGKRLYAVADSPEKMVRLPAEKIEKLIYPAGFYKTKAVNILKVCRILLDDYGGKVPDDLDKLLELPGVGRKTANLVITVGFGKPGICVDTHVHRISNRFGYVKTKNPTETEFALRKKLPVEYWIDYNDLLVTFGQNLCSPVSPRCSECPVFQYCGRVGVQRSR